MIFRSTLILTLLSLNYFFALAQQDDFVGLASVRIIQPINNLWSVQYATQTMFNQNVQELWIGFGEFSLHRKLSNHFSTGLYARGIATRDIENRYQPRQALFHTISYNYSKKSWYFNFRTRNQITRFGSLGESVIKESRYYSRNKLSIKKRWNYYWSNSAALELFLPLNGLRKGRIDQMRYTVNTAFRFNRKQHVTLYYQLQQLINQKRNNRYFVFGLEYTFTIL